MKIQLDRTQKIALARIISDLIEADFIVEEREMDFFENIISKSGLNISKSMLVEAKKMDLAKAVTILKELDADKRNKIVDCLKELALSDGTCVPLEAIQIFALEQALEHDAYIYSVPTKDIGIDNMQVVYIENETGTSVAKSIEKNFRSVSNEFALAGFDFVHIPFVVNDYKRMSPAYLRKVVRYMIPSVSEEKVASICDDLQNMTTAKFCRDLLYKKISLPLLDVAPSLLIKISDSASIEPYAQDDAERINYANFLRIELTGNVLTEIRSLIDSYHNMINCTIAVNSLPKNHKFMYYGFHRSLFDLIAFGKEQKEYNLVINLKDFHSKVYFEPVDGDGERIPIKLTPQEIALFAMIVKKSLDGKGLDWREKNMPNKLKQELLSEYNKIYARVAKGGNNSTTEYKDRTQVHHIKTRIRAIQCIANMDLFVPQHVKEGIASYYVVKGSYENIQIIE